MLDKLDLSLTLSDEAYEKIRLYQRDRLYELERIVAEARLPLVILLEGWDTAGKSSTVQSLTRRLDPRHFKVYPIQAPRTSETLYPWLWRFWMKIPSYGEMAIFDRSWYGRVLVERVRKLTVMNNWLRAYEEINDFERLLANDGMIFIKFWLHISKEEQLRRFIRLTQDPEEAWQITAEDWENHRQYDDYLAAVKDMLANTHTNYAPWSVVPATDRNYRLYTVYKEIIDTLEKVLQVEATPWAEVEGMGEVVTQKQKRKSKKSSRET
jgi:polyphosphate kinase 2 (PPK2 family)